MRRVLKPIKNSVTCLKLNKSTEVTTENGIFYKKKNVDYYRILDFSVDNKDDFPFEIGDVVMSNSVGDEIQINDDETVYLFKSEHIMCKIVD